MTYDTKIYWEDLPDSPGKRVLLKILNTPPVDREALHQRSVAYQNKLLAEWESGEWQKEIEEKSKCRV